MYNYDKLDIKRLQNGSVLYLRNVNSINSTIYIGIVIGSGSINEIKSGVAHILEHMLINGSLIQKISKIVGRMATTDFDNTVYLMEIQDCDLQYFMQFVKEMFCNIKLNKEDFHTAQAEVWKEYTEEINTDQHKMLEGLFRETRYIQKMPLGDDDIKNIKYEDVVDYYQAYYNIGNSAIILCGNLDDKMSNLVIKEIQTIKPKHRQLPNFSMKDDRILYEVKSVNIFNGIDKGTYYFVIDDSIYKSKLDYCYVQLLENYALYVLQRYICNYFDLPKSIEVCCKKKRFRRNYSFLEIYFTGSLNDFDMMIASKHSYDYSNLAKIVTNDLSLYKKKILSDQRYGMKLVTCREECIQNYIFDNQIILFDEYNLMTMSALERIEGEDVIQLLNKWFFENDNYRKIY